MGEDLLGQLVHKLLVNQLFEVNQELALIIIIIIIINNKAELTIKFLSTPPSPNK